MHMYECPRFEACSAPICPLDDDWKLRRMLKRERTCHYLREVSKSNWEVIASDAVDECWYVLIESRLEEFRQHSYELRQMLDEASKTGTYTKARYSQ
jgi:hypothetical protein